MLNSSDGLLSTLLTMATSSLVSWPIGCYMGFFASRYVGIIPHATRKYPAEPASDVYTYNFPDDRLSLKILGEHLRLTCIRQIERLVTSLLCLPSGEHPNGPDWRRPLLLVCGRVQGCKQYCEWPLLCNRQHGHECTYFAHCSRILLPSYLDIEQAVVVVLRGYCHCTDVPFNCVTYFHA